MKTETKLFGAGLGLVAALAYSSDANAASPEYTPVAKSNPCDTHSRTEVTVDPNHGIVTVFATENHPSVVVVNSRTPGGRKTLRFRPEGNTSWHTINTSNDPDTATVVKTEHTLNIDTRNNAGFWSAACEPTKRTADAEVTGREQDTFTVDTPKRIFEVALDSTGKSYTKRVIPQGTNPSQVPLIPRFRHPIS